MSSFLAEFIGTAILIIMGNGVVANVVLNKTKGNNGGWIVITFGWAMAVFMGVFIASKLGSGGHLNPAVTIALSAFGEFDDSQVLPYIAGQMAGAFTGALIVWVAYKNHFDATEDKALKQACFCNEPAIRNYLQNFITEAIGTFILVFAALSISPATASMGTLDALPVALVVLAIGLSLGGPTGYAINPARDFAPRVAHFLLPIKNKSNSDWAYSWVPVLGPIVGACMAALLFNAITG